MENENMDAKQEEAETSDYSSESENEPELNDSEVAKTPESEKDWKTKYQESLVALRQEREKNKASREQYQSYPEEVAPENDSETVRRFLRAEADAQIAKKLVIDPGFKDRVDLVEQEMLKSGKNLEDADNAVVAKVLRQAMQTSQAEEAIIKPKQLKTTATEEPEPTYSNPTYKDVMRGKIDSNEARLIRDAMMRVSGKK